MAKKQLILASTSPYRKELLSRLGRSFSTAAPQFDEESYKTQGLPPLELAEKLAFLKAESLSGPGKVVIGGDQLVAFDGKILGKPLTKEKARQQLLSMQGKTHELITAVCVFDENRALPFVNITRLTMKNLTDKELTKYIELDEPLDCAGAYKIEKHGISLFSKIESDDFTAIQGLPLIELSCLLDTITYE